jgi:hypothetical protein
VVGTETGAGTAVADAGAGEDACCAIFPLLVYAWWKIIKNKIENKIKVT